MRDLPITKFRLLSDKQERKETIDWLGQNCPFFCGCVFPANVKISISEEMKERKPLFCATGNFCPFELQRKKGDMYIVKSGNAFAWINTDLGITGFNKKKLLRTRSAGELQEKGIISEIFCEGDTIMVGIDMLPSFDFICEDGRGSSTYGKMNIVAGTPFEQRIEPLTLIKIEWNDLQKIFSEKNLGWRFLKKMSLSHIINSWRLWAQGTNNADIKILSILYLYFIGMLPLEKWTFDGEKIDNGKLYLKKPRHSIHGFEVGPQELALFTGLRRQTIDDHILGSTKRRPEIKSIFEKYPTLSKAIKCENILHEGYKFWDNNYPLEKGKFGKQDVFVSKTMPISHLIEEIVLAPTIRKYI